MGLVALSLAGISALLFHLELLAGGVLSLYAMIALLIAVVLNRSAIKAAQIFVPAGLTDGNQLECIVCNVLDQTALVNALVLTIAMPLIQAAPASNFSAAVPVQTVVLHQTAKFIAYANPLLMVNNIFMAVTVKCFMYTVDENSKCTFLHDRLFLVGTPVASTFIAISLCFLTYTLLDSDMTGHVVGGIVTVVSLCLPVYWVWDARPPCYMTVASTPSWGVGAATDPHQYRGTQQSGDPPIA